MIAKLHGKVDIIKPTELILDVGGVGYQLSIPLTTYENIKDEREISLFVYTLHKEDQLKLFGFHREEEKHLFTMLLNIAGIGPSIALSIISSIAVNSLIDAVVTENSALLTRVPGIGKSKAEKLIFELKRKIKKLHEFTEGAQITDSISQDALEALVSLGFDETKSSIIIRDIIKNNPGRTAELIVKEALKQFS